MCIYTHANIINIYILCDTHGVLALTDERLFVVISLRSDCDELQRVWSGTELPVGRLHFLTGAVGQADAPNGILAE